MKTALAIHHSAIRSDKPQFLQVSDYHNAGAGGKWPAGFGIQYTYFIEKDGMLMQGKPLTQITWHAGSVYWNQKSIGVCLAGDFRLEDPTEAQLETLYRLWDRLGFLAVVLHSDIRGVDCSSDQPLEQCYSSVKNTSCPGNFNFRNDLSIRRMKKRLGLAKRFLSKPFGSLQRRLKASRLVSRISNILGTL